MKILKQIELGDSLFQVEIGLNDITIDRNDIDISLGYPPGELPPQFDEMVNEVISKLPDKCEIKAGYRILDVIQPTEKIDGFYLGDKFLNLHKIVSSQLKKSEKAALFLCTIGTGMENWSRQSMAEGDPTLSYIIDTVASATVEAVADALHEHIGMQMQKLGLKITNRYSPGYCNWSVAEQHILFSFLPENFCKVKLTESALMIPIKSISGIIGVGKQVEFRGYLCDKCGVKDCTYRIFRQERDKRIRRRNLDSNN